MAVTKVMLCDSQMSLASRRRDVESPSCNDTAEADEAMKKFAVYEF